MVPTLVKAHVLASHLCRFMSSWDHLQFAHASIQNHLSLGYGDWELFSHDISLGASMWDMQEGAG